MGLVIYIWVNVYPGLALREAIGNEERVVTYCHFLSLLVICFLLKYISQGQSRAVRNG